MQDSVIGKIIAGLLMLVCLVILFSTDFSKNGRTIVYDCNMAEWHPDIPKEVKEECRRMNRGIRT